MLRPTLLFGAVITSIGYLQFFEEAFVMTKGGPLDSTRSVTFFTYDQFGFGNYGQAAAASYLLFLAVVVFTFVQFRFLGEAEGEEAMSTVTARRSGNHGATYVALTVGLILMVLPFLWMVLSSIKPDAEVTRRAADLVAARHHVLELHDAVHQARLPALLPQLGDRRRRRHARQHRVLLDARLRAGQAGLPGQAGDVRPGAGHADDPRRRDVRAAVRPDHQHRPDQHARRACSCRSWPARSGCS